MKQKKINMSNSISTHETEMDEENSILQTPVSGRKSMPSTGVKKTLGHIRGIIAHMVDLVNQDPNISSNLSSELSSLVKVRANLKSNKETPDVIKDIKSVITNTPQILNSANPYSNLPVYKKRAQSKYEQKRVKENMPKRKVWQEDIEYYSNYSKNSLACLSHSHKRQKTICTNYLSFSEQEDSPIKFKVRKSKDSPKVSPFCISVDLKPVANAV